MKIKIWCPDNESEENAAELEIDDLPDNPTENDTWSFWDNVESEVKEFAERDHPHSDSWERAIFHARVGEALKVFEVYVEMEPEFYIAEKKPPATTV